MDDIAFVGTRMALDHSLTPDSFPVPTYLFFKGDERPGRNDVKVAGQAGKGDFRAAFP